MEYEINDKRKSIDFQGITFSMFKKSKVISELLSSIINSKIEYACYWSSELICAGHFGDLWDVILLYLSKYIHLGNPKLPIYIAKRIEQFKIIVTNGYSDNELAMRNNLKIRNLFAEVISVLCFSRKKHTFEPIKIKKVEEFNVSFMATRLKAPSIEYGKSLYNDNDPQELFIAINEFAYHISLNSKNETDACYWLEWILEYDIICRNKKEKCVVEPRDFPFVSDKFKTDPIWIVWEAILKECKERNSDLITKIINSLLEIYCIKFTSGVKKRRRFILYFAIALITEPVDFSIELINPTIKSNIEKIVKKINLIYKDIKKNEIVPELDINEPVIGIDGLEINKKDKTSLDKTIERIELFNKIIYKTDK